MMKSNKALARKILCGLLATGVIGVSGSALAAEITYGDTFKNQNGGNEYLNVSENAFFNDNATHTIGTDADNVTFKAPAVAGSPSANNALVITGNGTKVDINANEIKVGSAEAGRFRGFRVTGKDNNVLTVHANKFISYTSDEIAHARNGINTINLGTADKHIGHFEAHTTLGKNDFGVALLQANEGSTVNLYANKAILDGPTNKLGGVIGSGGYGTVNVNVGDLTINGNICGSYGAMSTPGESTILNVTADILSMTGDVNIGSDINSNNYAPTYSNFSRDTVVNLVVNNKATINGDINVNGNNSYKANTNDASTLNVTFNGDSVINGNITVKGSETTQSATVNLGGTGDMTASTGKFNVENSGNVNFKGGKWAINEWTGDGTGDATIAKDAAVNVKANGMKVATLKLDGTANLVGGNANVETGELSGDNGTVTTDSLDNSISAGSSTANGLTVQGTGDIADAIQRDASNAQKLANVVSTGEGESKKSVASEVKTAEGKVGGAYYAKVDKDGNIDTASEVHTENTTNRAITDMASISIMTWRQENNDMNKRLGELRDSKGEHGAWARMARGESKYGAQNVKNQYNYYQVGYDEKLSVNPNWTVGVALTRTEGTSTFTNGSGENKHTGFAVYGSYLADNGSFIDLIAKYARMDNDYKTVTGAGSGDYETNGYSLSAEYGKRFTKDNGFWIEPQVELTYGKVSSADYLTANKVQVSQGDTNSLVGRLGFSLGKDIKQGNVYVRASYLYDFDGETDVKMVDTVSGTPASYKQDLGGGWWEVGVGTNLNLSDATHLYFDVEKTYGGNVATPWQWNAGVRWSF